MDVRYEDSQPYKLGCMYEEIGAAMKNPNTKIDDLTAISLKYSIEINIVFLAQQHFTGEENETHKF